MSIGPPCPACGSIYSVVYDSRPQSRTAGGRIRRRRCIDCLRTFITGEVATTLPELRQGIISEDSPAAEDHVVVSYYTAQAQSRETRQTRRKKKKVDKKKAKKKVTKKKPKVKQPPRRRRIVVRGDK